MKKLKSLHDLLVMQVKNLYDAEKQIIKALPQALKQVQDEELQDLLYEHLQQTEQQVQRLERVFQKLEISPRSKKHAAAMEGLITELNETLQMEAEPPVMDAAIIACMQQVEHYEIAGYGCARTYAQMLGYRNIESILDEILEEEERADRLLTELAEDYINREAMVSEEQMQY